MSKLRITEKDLIRFGFKPGKVMGVALTMLRKEFKRSSLEEVEFICKDVLENPDNYKHDIFWSEVAEILSPTFVEIKDETVPLQEKGVSCSIYGKKNIETGALQQIELATMLPIAVQASLLPDAHAGYGLPIGGVLAVDNAVIPYGVGVDIGCRMALTMYDLPETWIDSNKKLLRKSLTDHTFFGKGVANDQKVDHEILDRKEFAEIDFVNKMKDKARAQLGSSGGGNHFVSWGLIELEDANDFNIPAGKYVGILTHSGSRGFGARIAETYTKIAMEKCKLPQEVKHLAWLDLNSAEGQEYWLAMNLAGDYASACHDEIHKRLAKFMGINPVAKVENHHNFAWKEMLNDKEVIVHRKGATPAGKGVLGVIPGSAIHPGYIVRGKGEKASINSASHGAGRAMSRTAANKQFTRVGTGEVMKEHGVLMIGGGRDENPFAYKDIEQVMKEQVDLVEVLGTFSTKVCRMAND